MKIELELEDFDVFRLLMFLVFIKRECQDWAGFIKTSDKINEQIFSQIAITKKESGDE